MIGSSSCARGAMYFLMQIKYNKKLVSVAKLLRREMTKEERRLWYDFLRAYSVRFTRQKILGKYVADFYSAQAKLIIELDGSQHYENENVKKDAERTAFLESYGLRVVRIPNIEVNRNFQGVCEYIDSIVKQGVSCACCKPSLGEQGEVSRQGEEKQKE